MRVNIQQEKSIVFLGFPGSVADLISQAQNAIDGWRFLSRFWMGGVCYKLGSPYLSPISPCSVCLYLRHLCGGDQSRTSQMSVCIAQAAPHAWRRQISAVRPAWREMIHTDTQITSTSCFAQPSQQFKCLNTFVVAVINIRLFYISGLGSQSRYDLLMRLQR